MRTLSGGPEGDKSKKFVRKSANSIKLCHFECQNFSPESQSPNLTHVTQESQNFQKLFTEKSRSQPCKWQVISQRSQNPLTDPPILVLVVSTTGMFLLKIPQRFAEMSEN